VFGDPEHVRDRRSRPGDERNEQEVPAACERAGDEQAPRGTVEDKDDREYHSLGRDCVGTTDLPVEVQDRRERPDRHRLHGSRDRPIERYDWIDVNEDRQRRHRDRAEP